MDDVGGDFSGPSHLNANGSILFVYNGFHQSVKNLKYKLCKNVMSKIAFRSVFR